MIYEWMQVIFLHSLSDRLTPQNAGSQKRNSRVPLEEASQSIIIIPAGDALSTYINFQIKLVAGDLTLCFDREVQMQHKVCHCHPLYFLL